MRKLHLPILLFLVTLLISCGSEAAPTPTATPQPTAEIAAAEEATATDEPTAEPTATHTAVPATNTPTTEPATPTSPPTEEPEATATEAEATAVETEPTATELSPTAASSTSTPGSPPPAPPASPGGVTAPTDANYPANTDKVGWENRIRVPAGFEVSYYGRVEGQPTSITFSPVDGQLYIAVQAGTIYKMDSSGGVSTYVSGYTVPTGIAFRPGTNQLYVSSRVRDENIGGEAQVSVVNRGPLI